MLATLKRNTNKELTKKNSARDESISLCFFYFEQEIRIHRLALLVCKIFEGNNCKNTLSFFLKEMIHLVFKLNKE